MAAATDPICNDRNGTVACSIKSFRMTRPWRPAGESGRPGPRPGAIAAARNQALRVAIHNGASAASCATTATATKLIIDRSYSQPSSVLPTNQATPKMLVKTP